MKVAGACAMNKPFYSNLSSPVDLLTLTSQNTQSIQKVKYFHII